MNLARHVGAAILLTIPLCQTAQGECPPDSWWNSTAPMPGPRAQTCAAVIDGKIYVFGDYNYSPDHDSAFRFDPETDSWEELAPMLTGRGQAAAAAVDGVIYVFGGNNCFSNCWLTTAEGYDVATDTWTALAPMPNEQRGHLSATAVDGKIYVMGGANSYIVPTFDHNDVYDPATDSWTSAAPLPHRRSHHAAVALDGKIYLLGGRFRLTHDDPHNVPEVDVFDPESGEWSEVASLPTPRWLLSAVALNGKIYAIGGREIGPNGETTDYLDLVEEYDPVRDCWRTVASLPGSQGWASAVVADRRMYIFGGYASAGPSADRIDTSVVGYPIPESDSGVFADLNGDGEVDVQDLNIMRGILGECLSADVTGDSIVDVDDLVRVILEWGACE